MEISEGVFQIGLGPVNAFIIEDNGLILVDTGLPGKKEQLFNEVRRLGFHPSHIKSIIITHLHTDHTGNASEIKNQLDIPIFAHVADAELIERGISARATNLTPGFINWMIYHLVIKKNPQIIEPVVVDEKLIDNDLLPFAGGIRIIHSPGHSAGHIALLLENRGILIGGDICSNVFNKLDYTPLYEDIETGRQSILKAASFSFDKAVFGHGSPLTKNANKALLERFKEKEY
ncbi:MBL fold metallo-hydrolase [Mucilaginibacter flavus]|uniref:MBL fold metallo-hydrolase n=1 Tax=Mucilaginibacter flavus TaxID=931504 RepID=UPI0025B55272|nr:MBL fold metallo-hydrolase [Mucilaginibacter flavus]MDN3584566.1 MBL fold metallo-hydrolase [Mucilaginibacter flavus]